jgi:acyl carrier protein
MEVSEVAEKVCSFILENSTELMTTGILDSVSTLKMVTFLEETFGISVEAHEANEEHLNTVADICELVLSKR